MTRVARNPTGPLPRTFFHDTSAIGAVSISVDGFRLLSEKLRGWGAGDYLRREFGRELLGPAFARAIPANKNLRRDEIVNLANYLWAIGDRGKRGGISSWAELEASRPMRNASHLGVRWHDTAFPEATCRRRTPKRSGRAAWRRAPVPIVRLDRQRAM